MTSRWRWDSASADPASHVWPKPDDCDLMNEIEKFASKFLSAKIFEVLNPTGWANADGPPFGPSAEPDYNRRANFKDLDQQWFYAAGCEVFRMTFANPPENSTGSWSELEIDNIG